MKKLDLDALTALGERHGYQQVQFDEEEGVVALSRALEGSSDRELVRVWYRSGTVGSYSKHPTQGKTALSKGHRDPGCDGDPLEEPAAAHGQGIPREKSKRREWKRVFGGETGGVLSEQAGGRGIFCGSFVWGGGGHGDDHAHHFSRDSVMAREESRRFIDEAFLERIAGLDSRESDVASLRLRRARRWKALSSPRYACAARWPGR